MFDDVEDELGDKLDKMPQGLREGFPSLNISQEGGNIVVSNFGKIIRDLNRDKIHLKKYISKSLGAKTKIKGDQLIITAQLIHSQVEEVFEYYFQKYVICNSCGKPDTLFRKEGKNKFIIHCLACGSESVVS